MQRVNKDLGTRLGNVVTAWDNMRPHKQFFGLTVEELKLRAKPYVDARAEIADLEARMAHAASQRDAASVGLLEVIQGVVSAVKGDPAEGQNGELYAAMGYVPKNQRASGLVRRGKAAPAESADSG
jgi:hypothetical protein